MGGIYGGTGTTKTLVKVASSIVKGSDLARADEKYLEIIVIPSAQPFGSLSGLAYNLIIERDKLTNGNAMHLLPGSELAIEHLGGIGDVDRKLIALYAVAHPEYNGPNKISKRPFYRF